jgi:hypothetical protein
MVIEGRLLKIEKRLKVKRYTYRKRMIEETVKVFLHASS